MSTIKGVVAFGVMLTLICSCRYVCGQESRLVNGVFVVNVSLNGTRLAFLLDSGAERSAIDKDTASRIGLSSVRSGLLLKPFGSEEAEVLESSKLCVPKNRCVAVSLVASSMKEISDSLGQSVDGVLGSDVLRSFLVRIDCALGQVTFSRDPRTLQGKTIRLEQRGRKVFIPLTVKGSKLALLLDTGTNFSALSAGAWNKLEHSEASADFVDGIRSPGSPQGSKLTCFAEAFVGGEIYKDVVMRVLPRMRSGMFGSPGLDGLLGTDFFRRFVVILDLGHKRISLAINPRFTADGDRFNTIGIQFLENRNGFFTIAAVWKPSPAATAGLHEGDEIISVNNADVAGLDQDGLSVLIHGQPGTKVGLVVDVKGERRLYKMAIEKLLCRSQVR